MDPSQMDTSPSQDTPSRMATRGGNRVNYAEMNNSGSLGFSGSSVAAQNDDNLFRTPMSTTRGRKRRITDDMMSHASTPASVKRGRPRGAAAVGRGGLRTPLRRVGDGPAVDFEERGLFGAVKSGKNMDGIIDDWVDDYERNPDEALLRLQQFILNCSGCKGVLTSQMVHTMEYSDIIRRMTEDFDEDSGDYPLVMTGPHWKKFRNNLHTMLYLLIEKCKSSIIYDERMMDSVIQLLTSLADSQVRAFRHTATFAAMKISSALVDVTIEIVSVKDKNAKQIEAEKAKLKSNAGTNEKLDVLIQKKNEYEERTDEVRQQLQYIFKSVFVHRYRDVLPDTRSICITELGQWMMIYPEHFLDDSYLKYIGWSLHDKQADVRLKCIAALLPLYDKTENLLKLELFTNKFKDRLVSMVLDKDNEVAMQTCKLMTCVYRVFPTLLSPDDCIPIYELVYANHRGLAVAAGEFLNTKVFQHPQKSRAGSVASSAGRGMSDNTELIKDLVLFFIEGECHDHASYLVDALIESNPMMKDWQAMTDLLLSDEVEKMEAQLIEILVCAARQTATGESPIGRGVTKRGAPSTKESRVLLEDKARLSEVLIPAFPQIVQKFIADKDKVTSLMTIPLYFQLDMYMAGRLETYLNDLMRVIDMVVEKHTDEEILTTVAEVVTYFTTNTNVAQHIQTSRLKLIDGLALQLRHTVQRFLNEQQWDDEDEAALLASFRKVTAFVGHMDMKTWGLWDTVLSVLTNHDGRAPQDVLDKSLMFLCLQLSWDLHRFVKDIEPNKNEAMKHLKKERDQFIHIVESIMTESASGVELGFHCLADVLVMFNDQLPVDNPALEPLVVKLDNSFISKMKMFVSDNVFSDAGNDAGGLDQQARVDLMHKKRKILTQYCKMVLYGVFKISDASCVLINYCNFYQDYGDILKQLLYRCRDLDFVACAKAVVKALMDTYENIRDVSGLEFVDPLSESFNSLRDLAKRFASAFGNDHVKNREAVASVHRDGIQYALSGFDPNATRRGNKPMNISFLEIIMEFSPKLLRQDKLAVMHYLERHVGSAPNGPPSKDNTWEPYTLYKGSLTERHLNDDVSSVRSFSTMSISRGGRGKARGGRGLATPTPSEMD